MTHRFNPPPGWPVFPEGWQPPEGFEPDPAWPAPPEDHQWWLPPVIPLAVPLRVLPPRVGANAHQSARAAAHSSGSPAVAVASALPDDGPAFPEPALAAPTPARRPAGGHDPGVHRPAPQASTLPFPRSLDAPPYRRPSFLPSGSTDRLMAAALMVLLVASIGGAHQTVTETQLRIAAAPIPPGVPPAAVPPNKTATPADIQSWNAAGGFRAVNALTASTTALATARTRADHAARCRAVAVAAAKAQAAPPIPDTAAGTALQTALNGYLTGANTCLDGVRTNQQRLIDTGTFQVTTARKSMGEVGRILNARAGRK